MFSNQASVPNPLSSCLQINEDTLFCLFFTDDKFPKMPLCTYSFLTDTCSLMRMPLFSENQFLENSASGKTSFWKPTPCCQQATQTSSLHFRPVFLLFLFSQKYLQTKRAISSILNVTDSEPINSYRKGKT